MITVKCFENVTLYHSFFALSGISNSQPNRLSTDMLYMKVDIDGNIHNYYQVNNTILINHDEMDISDTCVIGIMPLRHHLEFLTMSKRKGIHYYVRINGVVTEENEYELVDITRTLKLKQLIENDRYRNIIKTHN